MTSLVRPSGRSIASARPSAAHGNFAISTLRPCFLRVGLGEAAPGDFRIGEHDRGNRLRLERDVVPERGFDRHARFVRGLVREHRLADDVANREDGRLGGAHRRVDLDEAAIADFTRGLVEPGNRRVRLAADRDEHAVEASAALSRVGRAAVAFDADASTPFLAVLHLDDARVDRILCRVCSSRRLRIVDKIAIGARQQARRHLDDGDLGAERRVDRPQLEADVAAADDEQRLGDVGKIEPAGRVHHAGLSIDSPGTVAGREPVAMIACSNVSVLRAALHELDARASSRRQTTPCPGCR